MSNFTVHFANPWLLFLLIPAVALALLPYFLMKKRYRRTRNRIISVVLHCLVMALCITVLSGMTFSYDVPNAENELILLVDSSYSNREEKAKKDAFVESVLNFGGGDVKIGIVKFGFDQEYVAPLSNDAMEVYAQYIASDDPDSSATDLASALRFTSGLFTNPQTAKIVLVSDGIETDGSVESVIRSIAADGIKVDTMFFPNEEHSEVQIANAEIPEEIILGEPIEIALNLRSNFNGTAQTGTVTVYDVCHGETEETETSDTFECELSENGQTVRFNHTFFKEGLHELRFEVTSSEDTLSQNNKYYSYVVIEKFDGILIVENVPNESAELQTLLIEQQYDVNVLNIQNDLDILPRDLASLTRYEQVILVNIANSDMPVGFDELLYDYVHDLGGGLFTVGGINDVGASGEIVPHAYNRDDMFDTLYQQMLPVRVEDYTPPIAVMIIIDRSGSMGTGDGSKLEEAKTGALSCLDALSSRDFCGIMTLETTYSEEVRITPVSQRAIIRNAIYSITGGGGTVFGGAIERAGRALLSVNVKSRHIILVTDGEPSDDLDDSTERNPAYGPYIDDNFEAGITMSVIAIGAGGDNENEMREAARRGGGSYHSEREGNVGVLMYEDLMNEAIEEIAYGEPFTPRIGDITPVVANIRQEDMPRLTGYYGTRLKSEAKAPLMGEFVPIYAQWEFGAGKVGSFMSDLNGEWSAEFIASPTGRKLIRNIVESLFPSRSLLQSDMEAVFHEDNYTTQMSVYSNLTEGESVSVSVTPLSDEAVTFYAETGIPVTAADGYTRFTFVITCPGIYRIDVMKRDINGNPIGEKLTLYKAFSYSKEYDAFRDDVEITGENLLANTAKSGRGIVVTEVFEIFSTFSERVHKTYDPRIPFLIVAVVLFLLDIAVRKFKFKWIHELVRDHKEKKAAARGKS